MNLIDIDQAKAYAIRASSLVLQIETPPGLLLETKSKLNDMFYDFLTNDASGEGLETRIEAVSGILDIISAKKASYSTTTDGSPSFFSPYRAKILFSHLFCADKSIEEISDLNLTSQVWAQSILDFASKDMKFLVDPNPATPQDCESLEQVMVSSLPERVKIFRAAQNGTPAHDSTPPKPPSAT